MSITFVHDIKVSVAFVVPIITIILTFALFLGADQEETGERLMRSSQSYHTLPHPQVSCQTLPPQRVLHPLTLSRSIADRLSDPVYAVLTRSSRHITRFHIHDIELR